MGSVIGFPVRGKKEGGAEMGGRNEGKERSGRKGMAEKEWQK